MAITTSDGLITAWGAASTTYTFLKNVPAAQTIGAYYSLFMHDGLPGKNASSPGTSAGASYNDTSAGAYDLVDVTAPTLRYMANVDAWATQPGMLYIYDRLWTSGLIPFSQTSSLTIAHSGLPSRCVPNTGGTTPNANGFMTELWVENFTVMGAGTPTMTATYTNSDAATGRTATLMQTIVTAGAINRTYPFLLANGDEGVRAVTAFILSATMTSGNLRLVQRRLLAAVPLANNTVGCATTLGPYDLGMTQIFDDSCIELVWCASTTTAAQVGANITLVRG
jgi:hypothetical protein